jgi:ribosomal protein S12 methylthiotransferase
MYDYPQHISQKLIDTMATLDHLCKYLDMPIQHSEATVLERMGRTGTREALLDLTRRLRLAMPGITLRTTLMVGFPGESVKEFNQLCAFVREARFERMGVFPYSREDGTPAASMEKQVREQTKQNRRDRLMQLQQEIHHAAQRAKIGTPLSVMCDDIDPNGTNPNRYIGRTAGDAHEVDANVYFYHKDELEPGDVVSLIPTDCDEYDLFA